MSLVAVDEEALKTISTSIKTKLGNYEKIPFTKFAESILKIKSDDTPSRILEISTIDYTQEDLNAKKSVSIARTESANLFMILYIDDEVPWVFNRRVGGIDFNGTSLDFLINQKTQLSASTARHFLSIKNDTIELTYDPSYKPMIGKYLYIAIKL